MYGSFTKWSCWTYLGLLFTTKAHCSEQALCFSRNAYFVEFCWLSRNIGDTSIFLGFLPVHDTYCFWKKWPKAYELEKTGTYFVRTTSFRPKYGCVHQNVIIFFTFNLRPIQTCGEGRGFHDATIVGGNTVFYIFPLEYLPQNSLKNIEKTKFLVNFGVDIPAGK